jgi:hypothetical protein
MRAGVEYHLTRKPTGGGEVGGRYLLSGNQQPRMGSQGGTLSAHSSWKVLGGEDVGLVRPTPFAVVFARYVLR